MEVTVDSWHQPLQAEGQSLRLPTGLCVWTHHHGICRGRTWTHCQLVDTMKHLRWSPLQTRDTVEIFKNRVIHQPGSCKCPYRSDGKSKTASVFFFITGSSLNYLTCLALYLCLAVTHRQLNNSWRATTEGERRCGPHDSHAFRKHCCSQSKIPETNGPCLWSMLHVCHIVWLQNDFKSVASDMTLLLLKHISQCFFVRVCLCAVCLCKALISFQPSCSHHHLLLPLLVSLPPFSPYQMVKIIITTSDLKWMPAEVLMFCLWLQQWHWRCDLPTLRGSVNEWWMLYYK